MALLYIFRRIGLWSVTMNILLFVILLRLFFISFASNLWTSESFIAFLLLISAKLFCKFWSIYSSATGFLLLFYFILYNNVKGLSCISVYFPSSLSLYLLSRSTSISGYKLSIILKVLYEWWSLNDVLSKYWLGFICEVWLKVILCRVTSGFFEAILYYRFSFC